MTFHVPLCNQLLGTVCHRRCNKSHKLIPLKDNSKLSASELTT